MRDISAAMMAGLEAARERGLAPRSFVYFHARDRSTGAEAKIGLWTGDDDVAIPVVSALTGTEETRTYYGASNLQVSDIAYVSDLTTQTVTVTLSQIADVAQEVARTYDLRLARVEIHETIIDPDTGAPIAAAEPAFLGVVDGAPISTPTAGEDGAITISLIPDAIAMLERINPRKSSYEGQKRRSLPSGAADQFGLYSSSVGTWTIYWGKSS